MYAEPSLLDLVLDASILVQLVLASLVVASIISWSMIFDRAWVLKRARRTTDDFEQRFWSGGDLDDLYQNLERNRREVSGSAAIFRAGFKEYMRLRKDDKGDLMAVLQGTERSMRVVLSREMDRLEVNLTFLATVGSTSMWACSAPCGGIMHAFHALGNVQQATLALVAPGISEALVATAMGLFAAILAMVAYNRYSNQVERLNNRYQEFMEEFSTLPWEIDARVPRATSCARKGYRTIASAP